MSIISSLPVVASGKQKNSVGSPKTEDVGSPSTMKIWGSLAHEKSLPNSSALPSRATMDELPHGTALLGTRIQAKVTGFTHHENTKKSIKILNLYFITLNIRKSLRLVIASSLWYEK